MIIRQAQPHELTILSTLAYRSKAHWGYGEEFMQSCVKELTYTDEDIAARDIQLMLSEDACGDITGFYKLMRVDDVTAELDALFVEPGRIGSGIGKALFLHAKAAAVKMGVQRLLILSDPHAEDFYLNLGASLCAKRESSSIAGRWLPLLTLPV